MQKASFISLIAIILIASIPQGLAALNDLYIETAVREVDLTQRYASAITKFRISNQGETQVYEYLHAIHLSERDNIILVTMKIGDSNTAVAGIHVFQFPSSNIIQLTQAHNATIIKFDFKTPLEPSDSIQIVIEEKFKNRQIAYPKEIYVTEEQRILYHDNAYIFSFYEIKSQHTIFRANDIISFTNTLNANKLKNSGVKYGPYTDQYPFSINMIDIHCENNTPLISLVKATKSIHVSHWGNILVDGSYDLVNRGAELKGEFSRVDVNKYKPNNGKNAMKSLIAEIPFNSSGVWYRDVIGNISTSSAQKDKLNKVVRLNLFPRFPVLGGWKSNWSLSYNLGTSQYVQEDKEGGYMLKQLFSFPFLDLLAEEFELRVILPEGATEFRIELPFVVDSQSIDLTYNYLDTNGSPTLIFTKKNVIDFHNQYFYIHYKLSLIDSIKKPMLVFFAFLAVFLGIVGLNRLNLRSLQSKLREE